MANVSLPLDFKEFLRLLNANKVEYLLIGGYAVAYHGYPRATAGMDIWIAINPDNADSPAFTQHALLKHSALFQKEGPP